ncbi:hypothetical protein FOMG_20031 [Fusarium oxysporum f. sp. melonis 26406]|uniref:Uncharacterized protein n=1 Tax=Fusarium oxysporum f. sp. melonis 26406 TaxID=1089452 RepID=W9Z4J9_FUSOX|nr:hypothetical protein FOMG_20031 [Fusarium oxysporum f. sp. melonis 26406]
MRSPSRIGLFLPFHLPLMPSSRSPRRLFVVQTCTSERAMWLPASPAAS